MMNANHRLLQGRGECFHGIGAYAEATRHARSPSKCDTVYVLNAYTSLFKSL